MPSTASAPSAAVRVASNLNPMKTKLSFPNACSSETSSPQGFLPKTIVTARPAALFTGIVEILFPLSRLC